MNMPIVSGGPVRKMTIMGFPPIQDDMSAFMHTFDQARTLPGEDETWEMWASRNKVDSRVVEGETEMMISLLGLSSYLKSDGNKVDLVAATYDVGCHNHGGEPEYLDFLQFILSQSK